MYVSVEVPELSEYPQGFPKYWAKVIASALIGSTNHQVNALANTYIRLEAAFIEYRLGASKLREVWDTSGFNLGALNRSIAHFESCITDMHRAIIFYRRLRRHKGQYPLSLALNAEKEPGFVKRSVSEQVRLIRVEIHHLDEMLIKGKLQEGQPFALSPNGPVRPHSTEPNQTIKSYDRLTIGRRELLFTDLANWIREMGRYAEKIADFDDNLTSGRFHAG